VPEVQHPNALRVCNDRGPLNSCARSVEGRPERDDRLVSGPNAVCSENAVAADAGTRHVRGVLGISGRCGGG